MTLPTWMRNAFLATGVMNLGATAMFLPSGHALRELAGLPQDGHPFYLATVALFVFIFGLAYLWAGATGRAENLFVALAAGGKALFFTVCVWFWIGGALPGRAVLAGAADLVFAALFATWLVQARAVAWTPGYAESSARSTNQ